MDIINQLEALRQELCDEINTTPYGNERGKTKDRAITAIDNLISVLAELTIKEN